MSITKKIVFGLLIVSALAILFVVYKIKSNQNSTINPPTTTKEAAKYGDLQPGVSSLEDLTQKLGTSETERADGNAKILDYKSKNPNFNNEFTVQSDKLTFIKQIVTMEEKITITSLNQKYGNYTNILYGPLSPNGFNLYVYPNQGIAYIGNPGADIVLEIWYFSPTTFDNFKKLYGSEYSESYNPRP